MKMQELKKYAEELGIPEIPNRKAELIQAIQKAEGYSSCFGENEGDCAYTNCCFWDDCIAENKRQSL